MPLACYLGMTVAVPLLNGVEPDGAFLEHGLTTVGLAVAIGWTWTRIGRRSGTWRRVR